jgi:hypothetical protein
MRTISFIGFICLLQTSLACGFSMVPVFGADWYHDSGFNTFYLDNQMSSFGILNRQRQFEGNYKTSLDGGQTYTIQTMKESISDRTLFYQFHLNPKLQFMFLITTTTIQAIEASDDDGMINMESTSKNQLGLNVDYQLISIVRKTRSFRLHLTAGATTTRFAQNNIIPCQDWLRLYMYEITPRLFAGNYSTDFTGGIAGVFQKQNFRLLTTLSTRTFLPNDQGFVCGTEINSALTLCYNHYIPKSDARIEPRLGLNFEQGGLDWQQPSSTLVLYNSLAQGEDIFFSAGAQVNIKRIGCSFHYFKPLWENNFSTDQLHNKSQFLFTLTFGLSHKT